jgi:phosphate/sulfate permease
MFNTSNRFGNTLGIAVLGAFVVQQFSGNIASQLTQRGVPASLSASIASKVVAAGAQASQASLTGHLPLSPAVLRQVADQAFVDALHGSFLISSIVAFAVVLLAVFLLQQKVRQARPVAEQAGALQPAVVEAREI